VLGIPAQVLRAKGAQMRGEVKTRFSWDAVSKKMVELMQ